MSLPVISIPLSGRNLLSKTLAAFKQPHPLSMPLAALILGIGVSGNYILPWFPLLLAGLAALLASILTACRSGYFPILLLSLSFLCLGAFWMGFQQTRPLPPNNISYFADNQYHRLEMEIIRAGEPNQYGWQVRAEALNVDGKPTQGGMQLSGGHDSVCPRPGQVINAWVRLRPLSNFANPGSPDWVKIRAGENIYALAHAGKKAALTLVGEKDGFNYKLEEIRLRWAASLESLPPGPVRGLIRALTLGQRSETGPELNNIFSELGIAHLLSISGLHLALVWGWGAMILRFLFSRSTWLLLHCNLPRLSLSLAFIPALAYALLSGASIPTLRSLIMAACIAASLWIKRPYLPGGGLCIAALLLLALWPDSLFTISFQLSFIAVGAIITAARPASDFFRYKLKLPPLVSLALSFIIFNMIITVFLWPVTVINFHQVPWLSILANLIFIPLTGALLLPAALLAGLTSLLWPILGAWLTGLVWYPAQLTVTIAQEMAKLPIAVSYIGGPGLPSVILFYLASLLLVTGAFRWRLWIAGLLLALSLSLWLLPSASPSHNERLEAWVLDVGQGSATLVKLPDGKLMMVDCGTTGSLDPGQRIAAPFLWSMGISRLDILVISHPENDHFSGMPFLLRWFNPKELWINGREQNNLNYAALLDMARQREVKVRVLSQGKTDLGGAEIMIMWPPQTYSSPRSNDLSLWLGIGCRNNWLWLSGDNGPAVEKNLRDFPSGKHLLLAPHHGGKDSCGKEFLERLRPQAVIFSAGCVNSHGMPRADSLARSAGAGAMIYTTANQGCLHAQAQDEGWQITPFLSSPRHCPFSLPSQLILRRQAEGL
ncbi:MAG: DNA internalization-related competence protein ComEC/Rec2 [Desulfarculales bacterium]|jgi:competence protein ComEC|nr:DNA internalization-related competence protein ComEC/Rec2 [Desulfarculales bacterium]